MVNRPAPGPRPLLRGRPGGPTIRAAKRGTTARSRRAARALLDEAGPRAGPPMSDHNGLASERPASPPGRIRMNAPSSLIPRDGPAAQAVAPTRPMWAQCRDFTFTERARPGRDGPRRACRPLHFATEQTRHYNRSSTRFPYFTAVIPLFQLSMPLLFQLRKSTRKRHSNPRLPSVTSDIAQRISIRNPHFVLPLRHKLYKARRQIIGQSSWERAPHLLYRWLTNPAAVRLRTSISTRILPSHVIPPAAHSAKPSSNHLGTTAR